jgi:AcrR family transcriptional regulator
MTQAMAGPEDIRAEERPAREEQSARTRERILEALAAEIAARGREPWSVPDVARRAKVAVRTLYRHFPSREALLAGLEERGRRLLEPSELPQRPEQIAELCLREFDLYGASAPLLGALLQSSPGLGAPDPRRVEALGNALSRLLAPLKPGKQSQARALLAHLTSASAWHALHEQAGPLAGKTAAWAIRTLLADLERRSRKASRSRPDRKGRRS